MFILSQERDNSLTKKKILYLFPKTHFQCLLFYLECLLFAMKVRHPAKEKDLAEYFPTLQGLVSRYLQLYRAAISLPFE